MQCFRAEFGVREFGSSGCIRDAARLSVRWPLWSRAEATDVLVGLSVQSDHAVIT